MTSYVENETNYHFEFDVEKIIGQVMETVLEMEQCPYEATINVLLTDNNGIHEYNKEYRDIDRETDVLSFPGVDFIQESDFSLVEHKEADYFDPDSGELLLGDIIISVDKVKEQSTNYGHTEKRELAFLVAHSMLHLCGYDHIQPEEAVKMEAKQKAVLDKLGITRD